MRSYNWNLKKKEKKPGRNTNFIFMVFSLEHKLLVQKI